MKRGTKIKKLDFTEEVEELQEEIEQKMLDLQSECEIENWTDALRYCEDLKYLLEDLKRELNLEC